MPRHKGKDEALDGKGEPPRSQLVSPNSTGQLGRGRFVGAERRDAIAPDHPIKILRLTPERLRGIRRGHNATREILGLDRQPDSTYTGEAV
jgi:hypothetical protein